MIRRNSALLAVLTLAAAPAAVMAQEINTDTGMDTPADWMAGTGTSVTGGKGVFTSVTGMESLMQMNPDIKKGHQFRITLTVTGYTGSGELRAAAGVTHPSSSTGSWIPEETDIPDTFTTSLGTTTMDRSGGTLTPKASFTGPGDSAERGGAIRFSCMAGKFDWVDPLINPGTISSHPHLFFGNSGVEKDWTFEDFRTKGSTTCGEADTAKGILYPGNRSSYWMPPIMDNLGYMRRPTHITVYYKTASDPGLNYTGHISVEGNPATACGDDSYAGDCRNIPIGLRMITGYSASGNNCGPADTACIADNNTGTGTSAVTKLGGSNLGFDCWDRTTGTPLTVRYTTLSALLAGGVCTTIGVHEVRAFVDFPSCWMAPYVDSADHRSHMSYSVAGKCPSTHPVKIPGIGVMAFFPIDAAFLAGKWHLTSDEMVNGAAPGSTLHFDYWEAWSRTLLDRAYEKCILAHNSCGGPGELGDGTAIGGPVDWDGSIWGCNGCAKVRPDALVPTSAHGMSKSITANGTYTFELTAVDDGAFSFMGLNGFSGSIDDVHVEEIGTVNGPATVTGSGG